MSLLYQVSYAAVDGVTAPLPRHSAGYLLEINEEKKTLTVALAAQAAGPAGAGKRQRAALDELQVGPAAPPALVSASLRPRQLHVLEPIDRIAL